MLQPCTVMMDGSGKQYPAFHDPARRWNGWIMPYLTKETAQRFTDDQNAVGFNMTPDAFYDPAQDAFCFPNDYTEEVETDSGTEYHAGLDTAPAVHIDGQTLYDFNLGWCWYLAPDED